MKKKTYSRLTRAAAVGVATAMMATPAPAAFHLWNIREVYSDASGDLQFIELFNSFSSENFVAGMQIRVTTPGFTETHTFSLTSNLPGDTANHSLLIGTAGIQAAGGPAPDFIMPNDFLFLDGGFISFFGANGGSYTALPTDGVLSRTWGDGNAINSPQNYAGQQGFVVVPEPSTWALLGLGAVGLWFFRRRSA